MAVMSSYLFLILCFIIMPSQANINADNIHDLPVAYCLNDTLSAPSDPTKALYFEINVCEGGIANKKQAELSISLPNNIYWNINKAYVVVQVSKCKDSFESQCVLYQNFKDKTDPEPLPAISWNISFINTTTYYLRVMAVGGNTEFSMELSFDNDYSGKSFPWSANSPFEGTAPNTPVKNLIQYWRADAQYQIITNNGYQKFNLAYCPQSYINGINVATSTLPNAKNEDVSLIHQWACVHGTNIDDCTQINNNWDNHLTAGFDLLECKGTSTAAGIHVIVQGTGNEIITFILTAKTF